MDSSWLAPLVQEWALAGLFLSALISSTLLPGGSEALLAWQVATRDTLLLPVLVATAGNVCGSLITFWMGHWLRRRRPLHVPGSASHQRAQRWLLRFGPLALLLAWLPLVGDPLCLVAGWLGFGLRSSLVCITLGKLSRYLVVAGLFAG